jgi:hypothetical protein
VERQNRNYFTFFCALPHFPLWHNGMRFDLGDELIPLEGLEQLIFVVVVVIVVIVIVVPVIA